MKIIRRIFMVILIVIGVGNTVYADGYVKGYNIKVLENSILEVISQNTRPRTKIIITKGKSSYTYSLKRSTENIPLQLGEGSYEVKIAENLTGNKYKIVRTTNINNKGKYDYLSSSNPVDWETHKKVIHKAEKVIWDSGSSIRLGTALIATRGGPVEFKGATTDMDKVIKTHKYITNNIKYDHYKASNLPEGYEPNISRTLEDKKGICYDYASLFTGMMRSQGVPTKLVKGYSKNIKEYHAWNEVYVNGKWEIIDNTYDAAYIQAGAKVGIFKNRTDYTTTYYY